jgi:hypothetical protein
MSKKDTVELKLNFVDSWLIVKGLSAYMIFGSPSKEEFDAMARIFRDLQNQFCSRGGSHE